MNDKEKLLLMDISFSSPINALFKETFPLFEPSYSLLPIDKKYFESIRGKSKLFTCLSGGIKVYRLGDTVCLVLRALGRAYSISFNAY